MDTIRASGRGFLREPCGKGLNCTPYLTDEFMAIMPEGHRLSSAEFITLDAFLEEPFLALEHESDTEVAEIFREADIALNIGLATWDDYAIMAMVERGLGLAILPSLILSRTPYRLVSKPLAPRAFRHLFFATKASVKNSMALERFINHLYRH